MPMAFRVARYRCAHRVMRSCFLYGSKAWYSNVGVYPHIVKQPQNPASHACMCALWHTGIFLASGSISLLFNNTRYAVAASSWYLPAAAWYVPFHLYFVFALAERKNEIQKEG